MNGLRSTRFVEFAAISFATFLAICCSTLAQAKRPTANPTPTPAPTGVTTTIYVNKGNPCPGLGTITSPYCNIQNALNVALPGMDIRVQAASTPYDESATLTMSGTSIAPIIIEADDASNPPILRYSGNGQNVAMMKINNYGYTTIQNLVFDGTGIITSTMALWLTYAGGWSTPPGMQGVQILNNTFKNWANSTSVNGYYGGAAVNVGGGWAPPVGAYTINGTVVQGNIFDGASETALAMTSTYNSLVQNNEFKNVKCGTANDGGGGTAVIAVGVHTISGTSGVGSGDVYRHNTFHDYQDISLCPYTASPGSYTELAGIHCDVDPSNGTVDSNDLWNINSTSATNYLGAGIFIEWDCHGWVVENNLVHDMQSEGIFNHPGTNGALNYFVNNTIYNVPWFPMVLNGGDAVVENNIITKHSTSPAGGALIEVDPEAVTQGNVTVDYNDYFDAYTSGDFGRWNGSRSSNFSSWQSVCNCDAHSINHDANFVSTTTPDLHLQSISPAINAGITLSLVPVDYDGVARPQGPAYDIGAYEYH